MIEDYIIKNMIGSGTFGDIFLGYDKVNKCNVAIKKIVLIDFKEKNINMIWIHFFKKLYSFLVVYARNFFPVKKILRNK
mgnify:CR=1 FL=1